MGLLLSHTHLQDENNSLQTVFYTDRLYNYRWVNPPKCFFVACEYLPNIVIGGLQCKNLTWESVPINPFAPEDFAEKRVLKLVEWFSGHCRAIKG